MYKGRDSYHTSEAKLRHELLAMERAAQRAGQSGWSIGEESPSPAFKFYLEEEKKLAKIAVEYDTNILEYSDAEVKEMRRTLSAAGWQGFEDSGEWLSIQDVAFRLKTNDAGVFQKAIQGELTLSVRFIDEARGRKCTGSLTMEEAKGLHCSDLTHQLKPQGEVITLTGVYDLPMLGADRERIEIEYLNRLDDKHASDVHITTLKSAYVRNIDGTIYELQFLLLREGQTPTINDYRSTGDLPDNIQFVVRRDMLSKVKAEIEPNEGGEVDYNKGNHLSVFKDMESLKAEEVTVTLLKKDEESLPDRLKIAARKTTRTVFMSDLGLTDKRNGLINRAGQMLFSIHNNTIPKSFKSDTQAMKDLRKVFREFMENKDPFYPKNQGMWKPRFILCDAIEKGDKRKKEKASHSVFDDNLQYDKEADEADMFLKEYDEKH